MKHSQGNRSGFTLVEMMVTVSVMALVGGLLTYNMIGQAPRVRLEQAQYQLMSDYRAARMEAVSRGVNVQITVNGSARTYSIWVDANRNGSTETGETKTKSLPPTEGLSMWAYPTAGIFKPNGTFQSSYLYQYVSLSSPAGYRYVYIFPSGQVDIWSNE